MKKIILLFYASCIMEGALYAQVNPNADPIDNLSFPSRNKIHFYYDFNGNRIKRTLRVIYCDNPEEGDPIDVPPEEEIAGPNQEPRQKSAVVSMGVNVFPNPATDRIHVTINSESDLKTGWMGLYDMQGKEVIRKSNLKNASLEIINLDGLSAGTYLLNVYLNERVFQYKIIKDN